MSRRRGDPKKTPDRSGLPTWAIAVGLGVLVIVGVVVLFNVQTPRTLPSSTSNAIASGRTKGDPNAKIELVEWSDFQ